MTPEEFKECMNLPVTPEWLCETMQGYSLEAVHTVAFSPVWALLGFVVIVFLWEAVTGHPPGDKHDQDD